MLKTKDNRIEIEIVKDISGAIFYPSDWSIINVPHDADSAKRLFSNLYNTAVSRHVILGLFRYRRKERVSSMSCVKEAESAGWTYLETVNISYEKPSSCSNNGFLPMSEVGVIFYKGDIPDTKGTAWFSDDKSNATNLWDISPQEKESSVASYYQKFNWETSLLIKSMIGNGETRRFVYGFALDEEELRSLYAFCREYYLTARIYAKDHREANAMMNILKGE